MAMSVPAWSWDLCSDAPLVLSAPIDTCSISVLSEPVRRSLYTSTRQLACNDESSDRVKAEEAKRSMGGALEVLIAMKREQNYRKGIRSSLLILGMGQDEIDDRMPASCNKELREVLAQNFPSSCAALRESKRAFFTDLRFKQQTMETSQSCLAGGQSPLLQYLDTDGEIEERVLKAANDNNSMSANEVNNRMALVSQNFMQALANTTNGIKSANSSLTNPRTNPRVEKAIGIALKKAAERKDRKCDQLPKQWEELQRDIYRSKKPFELAEDLPDIYYLLSHYADQGEGACDKYYEVVSFLAAEMVSYNSIPTRDTKEFGRLIGESLQRLKASMKPHFAAIGSDDILAKADLHCQAAEKALDSLVCEIPARASREVGAARAASGCNSDAGANDNTLAGAFVKGSTSHGKFDKFFCDGYAEFKTKCNDGCTRDESCKLVKNVQDYCKHANVPPLNKVSCQLVTLADDIRPAAPALAQQAAYVSPAERRTGSFASLNLGASGDLTQRPSYLGLSDALDLSSMSKISVSDLQIPRIDLSGASTTETADVTPTGAPVAGQEQVQPQLAPSLPFMSPTSASVIDTAVAAATSVPLPLSQTNTIASPSDAASAAASEAARSPASVIEKDVSSDTQGLMDRIAKLEAEIASYETAKKVVAEKPAEEAVEAVVEEKNTNEAEVVAQGTRPARAAASIGAGAAPVVVAPRAVEISPAVAAVAPPLGFDLGNSIQENASVFATAQSRNTALGLPKLSLSVNGVSVVKEQTGAEQNLLDVGAPPAAVTTVDGVKDFIKSKVTPEMLSKNGGPLIIQLAGLGSLWRVELNSTNQLQVTEVPKTEVVRVQRTFLSNLRSMLAQSRSN